MSLQAIEQAIEKIAAPSWGGVMKKVYTSAPGLKQLGTHAAIGAGAGAVGNVALGDKDQSVMERALKGGAGGAVAGGLFHGAKTGLKVRSGLAAGKATQAATAARGKFVFNPSVHGAAGSRTPEQMARLQSDMKAWKTGATAAP